MKYRNESQTIDSEIWVALAGSLQVYIKRPKKEKNKKEREDVRMYVLLHRLKDTRRCPLFPPRCEIGLTGTARG